MGSCASKGKPDGQNESKGKQNPQSESRPLQKDFRILRCFCGCSQLTFEEIERYAMMDAKGIAQNDKSKQLLKTFLQLGHRSDKSNALILLECYEYCECILNDLNPHEDYLEKLLEVCPSELWERKITDAWEKRTEDGFNREQLDDNLKRLKIECLNEIEGDHDFRRFRGELLRKIGK